MGIDLEEGLLFENVRKTYRNGVQAVNGISLHIPKRCVHAFLGPNGAGKTTALKAALGFISYEGAIRWDERPIGEKREKVVFVPEEKRFYEHWTLFETLKICPKMDARLNAEKMQEYFHFFELPTKKKIHSFSLGMKTALYLSLAFSTDSDYIVLDEPTSGLDPIKRDDVLEIIRKKVIEGKTVLYTSHIIPEVEKIADTFSILRKGFIVYNGALDGLKEKYRVYTFSKEAWERQKAPENAIAAFSRNQVTVLTDAEEAIALWNREKDCFCEIPTLESFFQLTIRGNRYV